MHGYHGLVLQKAYATIAKALCQVFSSGSRLSHAQVALRVTAFTKVRIETLLNCFLGLIIMCGINEVYVHHYMTTIYEFLYSDHSYSHPFYLT